MFAINRRQGQSLVIDRDVKITVLKMSPSIVKLGVESAREHCIERVENPYWRYIAKQSDNMPKEK